MGFLSDSFKNLGKLQFLRKGDPLPASLTSDFNSDNERVRAGDTACNETTLTTWFDCPANIQLDEEVVGLGSYGLTLTVLSSDALTDDPYEDEDDDEKLENNGRISCNG